MKVDREGSEINREEDIKMRFWGGVHMAIKLMSNSSASVAMQRMSRDIYLAVARCKLTVDS